MGGLPRKATDTMVILITWEVRKEHNNIIFHNRTTTHVDLVARIKEEGRACALAGSKCLEHTLLKVK